MKKRAEHKARLLRLGQTTYFFLRIRPLPVRTKAITLAFLSIGPTQTFEELDAEALVYIHHLYTPQTFKDSAGQLSSVCTSVIYKGINFSYNTELTKTIYESDQTASPGLHPCCGLWHC